MDTKSDPVSLSWMFLLAMTQPLFCQIRLRVDILNVQKLNTAAHCGVLCMYPAFFSFLDTGNTPSGGYFKRSQPTICQIHQCQCQEFSRSTLAHDDLPQIVDYDDLQSHMVEHSFICEPLIVSAQKIPVMTEYSSKKAYPVPVGLNSCS